MGRWAAIPVLLGLSGCAALFHVQSATFGPYTWQEVAPMGSGALYYQWTPGKWPVGIMPLEARGRLWMIGQKEVWSSADGLSWDHQEKTDVGERIYTQTAFFKDEFWLFGGLRYQDSVFLDDIWRSKDGRSWTPGGTAAWSPRGSARVLAFKDRLWLFGGADHVDEHRGTDRFLNDIWVSDDGVTWTQAAADAGWSPRAYPRVVESGGALFLLGGDEQNDTFRSDDGVKWTPLSPEAPWGARNAYGAAAFDGRLWVFGGYVGPSTSARNDVWSSRDGREWDLQTESAPWGPRMPLSIVFKDSLWIFSGKHTGSGDSWGGDIWTMSRN